VFLGRVTLLTEQLDGRTVSVLGGIAESDLAAICSQIGYKRQRCNSVAIGLRQRLHPHKWRYEPVAAPRDGLDHRLIAMANYVARVARLDASLQHSSPWLDVLREIPPVPTEVDRPRRALDLSAAGVVCLVSQ
jgi:hypothetical protein